MTKIKEHEILTGFTLPSCSGEVLNLDQIESEYVVLYFYPKDDTPGCTLEAKEFSEKIDDFKKLDTVVYGISKDDEKSHNKFIEKYDLKLDLLTDNQNLTEHLGLWVEKSMYGKKYMGIERTTLLLDKTCKIVKIWNKVKPEGHASEVLQFIESLQ